MREAIELNSMLWSLILEWKASISKPPRKTMPNNTLNHGKLKMSEFLAKPYSEAERRSDSSSRQMWWQQEMDLEEDDEGAGGRGVFPCRFYDEAGNETDGNQGQGVMHLDPRERFIDRPDAAPEAFTRGIDLDG